MNSKMPRRTFRVSTNFPKRNYISKNILFLLTLRSDQTQNGENPNQISCYRRPLYNFASPSNHFDFSFLDSSPSFQFSPPPSPMVRSPIKKSIPDHVRITDLFCSIERTDNSCLPLHTIDVPFRRAFDLFFLFFPPTIFPPHAWSRAHLEGRNAGCYDRKKSYGLDIAVCDSDE